MTEKGADPDVMAMQAESLWRAGEMSEKGSVVEDFATVRVLAEKAPAKFLSDWAPESRAKMVLQLLSRAEAMEKRLAELERRETLRVHLADVLRIALHSLEEETK